MRNNLTLFVIGVNLTFPTATVIVGLVFAAGIDQRAERQLARDAAVPPRPAA